jgi:hypothetical protein
MSDHNDHRDDRDDRHYDHHGDHHRHLGHHHHHDDDRGHDNLPPTFLDATLDPTATDGNGDTLNGAGNSASGWETETKGPFQLGTDVHYRQGDTVQPVAVDQNGTLFYEMPAGPQVVDAMNGVPVASPNRAATSFDYSFDTGVGPGPHQTIQQFLASGGEFIYKIDLDPGQDNDPLVLHAVYDPVHNAGGSHVVWEDSHGHIVIADDGGNQFVTQNSQNYAFYQSLIDVDPHAHGIQTGPVGPAGTFDIEAEIIKPHDNVVADIHSTLEIGGGAPDDSHDHDNDGHGHDDALPLTFLNATLDPTATNGNGDTLNGAGNPAAGWETQTEGKFQLGTDVHYRQGDIVQPVAVDHDGTLIYHMPAGAQVADPAHDVPGANTARAATSFDYSFDTDIGAGSHQTIQQFLASGGEFIYKIDLNPGQDNDPLVLHAVYDPTHNAGGSHVVWEDSHNDIVIGDDGGNAFVTQNSQNYAFYQSLIDVDPHTHGVQTGPIGPAGTFDIEAEIVAPHNNLIADIHSSLVLA